MSISEILGITISTSDLQNPRIWLTDALAGRRTSSGEHVNPGSALALSAYFAALRAISEDVAKIPLQAFRSLSPAGREPIPDHPATQLLMRNPNPEMTAMTFRELMQSWALGHGDAYAEIVRNGRGEAKRLWPIHPANVTHERDENGIMFFKVARRDQETAIVFAEDMFHIHGIGPDGLQGWSIARLGAESLGLGLALQKFGAAFFGNSMRASGVLETPVKYDANQEKTLRDSYEKGHTGSADNAHRFMVLWNGMKWTQQTVPPNEAQFIESRAFQIEEVARWFRMPPSKLHHLLKANFNSLEMQNMEYFQDTLDPWLTRWEQEADRKLLTDSEVASGFLIDHDMSKINRTDQKTRAENQRTLFNIGVLSQNEIREQENKNPVEGGDERYIPMNLVNIKQAAKQGNTETGGQERSQAQAAQSKEQIQTYRHHTAKAIQASLERFARKEIKICERQGAKFEGFPQSHLGNISKEIQTHLSAFCNYLKCESFWDNSLVIDLGSSFAFNHLSESWDQFQAAIEADTVNATLQSWQHERPAAEALKLVSECERFIHETQEQN